MATKQNVELRVTPDRKESTCNNSLNFINILTGFSYIIYNFTIEYSNWDKLTQSYDKTIQHTETRGNETFTWNIDKNVETDAQVIRLEEVCKNVDNLNFVFVCILLLTGMYSAISFLRRQYKIVMQACLCKEIRWAISITCLIIATSIQSMVGLFIVILLSPTSFLTCYTNIARYFCTIALGVLIGFGIYNVVVASITHSILCHKIQYSQLQEVGRNCEVDVVRVNARKKYTDKKYDDQEDIPLNDVDLDNDNDDTV